MELVSHIGLKSGPESTPRSVAYKVWSLAVLYLFILVLIWYNLASAAVTAMSYVMPQTASKLRVSMYRMYWRLVDYFVSFSSIKISITGDKIVPESALIISNHQSIVDHFLIHHLAKRIHPESRPQINFFTWYSMWRVPSVRTLANVLLCDENWELSKSLCRTVFRPVTISELPQWVALFPEVNIWTPAAAYSQRMQARQYFLPFCNHTLYPRYSGLWNAVTTLRNGTNIKFRQGYDITILYHGRAPTLLQLFATLEEISVTIHVKSLPLRNIPTKRVKLEKWLEKAWLDKDKQLGILKKEAAMKKTHVPKTPHPVWDRPLSTFPLLTRFASRG